MFEKRSYVIRGFVVAGTRRTGTAAKRSTLTGLPPASLPDRSKRAVSRRACRFVRWRTGATRGAEYRALCTDRVDDNKQYERIPMDVHLALPGRAALRSAYRRHLRRPGSVGPGGGWPGRDR